jgi:stage IV sporulation protein FB
VLEIGLEPKRNPYDLHFRLWRIPVRIHPLFWLTTILMGFGAARENGMYILFWIAAVFVSILVHEFGHALMIRYFGFRPRVLLYMLGGLAIYDPAENLGYDPYAVFGDDYDRRKEHWRPILISLAGPLAGFLLAGLLVGVVYLAQGSIQWAWSTSSIIEVYPLNVASDGLTRMFFYLFQINIGWGLVNLLPIWPLDGGQIASELLVSRNGSRGIAQAFLLSVIVGAAVAIVALCCWPADNKLFGLLMFGGLALQNYMNYLQVQKFGPEIFRQQRPDRHDEPPEPWASDDESWRS